MQTGPLPVSYYVVALVIAVLVPLGLVMVLSSSSITQFQAGNSPWRYFQRQTLWAAAGLIVLWVALRIPLKQVRLLCRTFWLVSMGLMLESTAERLCAKGGPHFGSPDKHPAARLEVLRLAGELQIPFTTGILIGIGETREERVEALNAIRAARPIAGVIYAGNALSWWHRTKGSSQLTFDRDEARVAQWKRVGAFKPS